MPAAALAAVFEPYDAGDAREERIVLRAADVQAGLIARPTLPHQDAAAGDKLT